MTNLRELNLDETKFNDESAAVFDSLDGLEKLTLNARLTNAGMTHLAGLTKLRELDINRCNISDDGLLALSGLTKLEKLNAEACRDEENGPLTQRGLAALEKMTNLRELNISHASFSAEGMKSLTSCAKLEKLDISWNKKLDDDMAAELSRLSHLTELLLYGENLTEKGLTSLGRLTNLETLEFYGDPSKFVFTDAILQAWSNMTKISDLSIPNASRITDRGLDALAQMSGLKNLSLDQTENMTDSGFARLANLHELMFLRLGDCRQLTGDGLKPLADGLPKLLILALSNADSLEDNDLALLARFPELADLTLGAKKITEKGMAHFRSIPKLGLLTLDFPVTDAQLLAMVPIEKLWLLRLDASELTDAGCRTLGEMPNLQRLFMRHCVRLTDKAVDEMVKINTIQWFDLDDYIQLTDDGALRFAALDKKFHLDISGSGITSDGEKRLAELMPKCSLTTFIGCCSSVAKAKDLPIGSDAPSFEIPQITNASDVPSANSSADGEKSGKIDDDKAAALKLSDFAGRWLILDFLSTWCGPCIADMPRMKALYESRIKNNEKFALISIAADGVENADKVAQILEKQGVTWPVGLGKDGEGMLKDYGIGAFPTIVIINPEGKIAFVQSGANMTTLENQVEKILAPIAP